MDQALLSKGNRSTVTELKHPYLTSIVNQFLCLNINIVGSGCGSVGRAAASDTRGPRFESSHRQKFIYILNICLLSTVY